MREIRQQEAVQSFLDSDRRSIINACPRFGKIKVAIDIMKKMDIKNPMILAPRLDIEDGWKKDFKKFDMEGGYEFRTFTSIKKIDFFSNRLLILDEPHEMSVNQQKDLNKLLKNIEVHKLPHAQPDILGLTGTMTQKTRRELFNSLDLGVCFKYSIEQGVNEGILADYEIVVYETDLDNKSNAYSTKKKYYTEKEYFNLYKYLLEEEDQYFMELKMIKILQDSIAKQILTEKLIREHKDDRILVFCGTTAAADVLGIPAYHSKSKDKKLFQDFCNGKGKHIVTIKMMQAGITVSPINLGIINYMSGNPEDGAQKICRFLGLEYDNPGKKAVIYIVSSTEPFEKQRLETALSFFNQSKIKHLCA